MPPARISTWPKMSGVWLLLSTVAIHLSFCIALISLLPAQLHFTFWHTRTSHKLPVLFPALSTGGDRVGTRLVLSKCVQSLLMNFLYIYCHDIVLIVTLPGGLSLCS